jgi:hypothetical protein
MAIACYILPPPHRAAAPRCCTPPPHPAAAPRCKGRLFLDKGMGALCGTYVGVASVSRCERAVPVAQPRRRGQISSLVGWRGAGSLPLRHGPTADGRQCVVPPSSTSTLVTAMPPPACLPLRRPAPSAPACLLSCNTDPSDVWADGCTVVDAFVAASLADPDTSRSTNSSIDSSNSGSGSGSSSSSAMLGGSAGDPACSGNGSLVEGRCVCRNRAAGSNCQAEIGWLAYYGSGRKVTIQTDSGHFLSSSGRAARPNHAMSHTSDGEFWQVSPCGKEGGVGLVDNTGRWLSLQKGSGGGMIAEIVLVNASEVDCSDPHSRSSWLVDISQPSLTDEAVMFSSAVPVAPQGARAEAGAGGPAGGGEKSWYLTIETNPSNLGIEVPIAVAATTEQTKDGYEHQALWFRVRLQQFCQSF